MLQSFFMWTTGTLIDCADSQADLSLRRVHMPEGTLSRVAAQCKYIVNFLGTFVQSVVSLTSMFVVKMLTALVSTISNSQVFLLKKM